MRQKSHDWVAKVFFFFFFFFGNDEFRFYYFALQKTAQIRNHFPVLMKVSISGS